MKISVNWLRQFTDIELPIDELASKIGAQLGAVEEVINIGEQYKGILVAKVMSCEQHSNADKLKVCKIDDGGKAANVSRDENGYVQVVCGAPNVREGLTVAWLPPGTIVPSTYNGHDPLALEARELRGVVSNGMLASGAELAIGDDHSGIAELDTSAEPGTSFAAAYELDDYIIDIENKMFTHRPDCFGILGVAREIAGIQNVTFKSPEWYLKSLDRVKPGATKLPLEIRNEIEELVPRFMAIALADVKVGPSPFIIQTYLSRVGLKPINNIVDVTNYLMYLTGQPLHAYDYDKVKECSEGVATLVARKATQAEKIKLLNGKEIAFDDPAILIATDKQPVGVGGIMGGSETEVDQQTKNIILECANFNMYAVRKTSMKYGLFTDAVTRFNKGQSSRQNDIVLEEAVATLQYVGGGQVASEVYDIGAVQKRAENIRVSAEFINVRLGLSLGAKEMAQLLQNVEFVVDVNDNRELIVSPPFWRTDIEISEDIVEEIGRLYGYDHLPIELPTRSIRPAQRDKTLDLKSHIRDAFAQAGANEVLTYSFVHAKLLEKVGQDEQQAFKLSNALSPDLQYYRLSLTPSLLEKVHPNVKAGFSEFALFEIGRSHVKGQQDRSEPSVPMEFNAVSFVYTSANKKKHKGAAFFDARNYLKSIADVGKLSFEPAEGKELNAIMTQVIAPYEPSRSAVVMKDGKMYGVVGEFRPSVTRALKLPEHTAGFEVALFALDDAATSVYEPLSRFPKVEQDISLKITKDQSYQPVYDEMVTQLADLVDDGLHTKLEPLDIYEKGQYKHVTFRLTAVHHLKTLKSQEINQLLNKLAERAKQKFNAERI